MLSKVLILMLFGVTALAAPVENNKVSFNRNATVTSNHVIFIHQVQIVLPYYQLMTPDWLYKHSSITKPFTVYPKYLEIPAGTINERVIQAELIAPNILTTIDSVAVTVTIAMDTILAKGDHDPIFGISDGTSFVGFFVVDKGNYGTQPPCYNIEGDITKTSFINRVHDSTGTKVSSREYSSEITMQLKPIDQWGSCHTEHDEGTVKIASYQRKLDITKGLYLQMYREDATEKYHIKYIVVNIHLD